MNLVPGAGVEPARLIQARDFKSLASTNSATRAWVRTFKTERLWRTQLALS